LAEKTKRQQCHSSKLTAECTKSCVHLWTLRNQVHPFY